MTAGWCTSKDAARRSPPPRARWPAALNDTGLNGFDDSNATVTVNNPPASGSWAGNTDFVEVIITRTVPTYFMRVVNVDQATVAARAVSGLVQSADACIIALDRNANDALTIRGAQSMTLNGCGMMSNSADPAGLRAAGAVNVTADWLGVSGASVLEGGASVSPAPEEQVPPILDPLGYLGPPDWTGWADGYYDAAALTYVCPGGACVWPNHITLVQISLLSDVSRGGGTFVRLGLGSGL